VGSGVCTHEFGGGGGAIAAAAQESSYYAHGVAACRLYNTPHAGYITLTWGWPFESASQPHQAASGAQSASLLSLRLLLPLRVPPVKVSCACPSTHGLECVC